MADRLSVLDGLRGVAAFAILYLHYPLPGGFTRYLPGAYLAVDLFFILSGFVIAKAYGQRLQQGMPLTQFAVTRVIRLYPLYIAGTALAAALLFLSLLSNGEIYDNSRSYLATLGFSFLFLPTPTGLSSDSYWVYPLNFVAWSLLWELASNLLYAATHRWLKPWLLGALVLAGAVATGVLVYDFGSAEIGPTTDTFWGGAARAAFGFFAGVALYHMAGHVRLPKLPFWLLGSTLVVAFAHPFPLSVWIQDLAAIILLFPAIVAFGAHSQGSDAEQSLSHWLGYLSYPVYALQIPLYAILASGLRWTVGWPVETAPMLRMAVFFAFVIGLSLIAARYFDDPVRRALTQRFASRSSAK